MAIVKANYVKRGKGERGRAKASVRYIQHRRGQDGDIITRALFGSDGAMDRYEAYRIIDEAKKGSHFYRFVISPDPKAEDKGHDLDMRDIAYQTMQALEERVHQPILWVGAIHADHAPHLHAHLIAVVPKRLYVKDFAHLRYSATQACLTQRRFLDLARTHERERPYPLPTFANAPRYYSAFGKPQHAQNWRVSSKTHPSWRVPRGRRPAPLRTCTCPRCFSMHIHNLRNPVHSCSSCGLILHRQKQRTLTLQRKEAGWQR